MATTPATAHAPATYTATVQWQRQPQQPFTDNRYSRAHQWRFDGGAVVPGSASPLHVRPPYADPAAVDPEEALVAAASSCHLLCFLYRAAQAGWVVDAYDDQAFGTMGQDARGRTCITTITLRPAVRFGGGRAPDAATLLALHHQAHDDCYIANSLRSEVLCQPVTVD